jgi:large subunit ribosomal protein L4
MAVKKTVKTPATTEALATPSVVAKKATTKKAVVKNAPKTVKGKSASAKKTETLNTTQAAVLTKKKTAAVRNTVKIDVVDPAGKVVETLSLPGEIFAAKVNPTLMTQAVRVYLANQRRGTSSTKSRGEVEGSTRKIYRQKGTGRARHGGIRAPIFVGGGVAFGPKMRDHSLSLPQKMRRAALFSALTTRLKDKELAVVSGLEALEPKTNVMHKALGQFVDGKGGSLLLIVPQSGQASVRVTRAARNIAGVTYVPVNQLNTYAVLQATRLVLMKDAAEHLADVFLKEK